MSKQASRSEAMFEISRSDFLLGRELSHPTPGEEICISGIAGSFPNCKNIFDFEKNLMNKIDMTDEEETRWYHVYKGAPKRKGKLLSLQKFDAGFFGIPNEQAHFMDAGQRILFEKVIEAIFDAGMNPSELAGSKTGVFCSMWLNESEADLFHQHKSSAFLGGMRGMIPNRISHFLKLKGPSIVVDSACSSSLHAVENAFFSMRCGHCDMAIVAGINLIIYPTISVLHSRHGFLSRDGGCKTFSEGADGYCRAEAVNCIILQKLRDCRRIYCKLIHAKTSCDGFKDQGIQFPSGEMQEKLLNDFYEDCDIEPKEVFYVETHGTGTKVGDVQETMGISAALCPGRKEPLLIGSVKTNMGHAEGASGIASVIKCIIGMEAGFIPSNLHFDKPRREIPGLFDGRLKVVAENIPIINDDALFAVSNYGFGGANSHILLQRNVKKKSLIEEKDGEHPRLACFSGRTEEAVDVLVEQCRNKGDLEYFQLLNEISKQNVEGHRYRAYFLKKQGFSSSSSQIFLDDRPKLLLFFGSLLPRWREIARNMLIFPAFSKSMNRVKTILLNSGLKSDEWIDGCSSSGTFEILGTVVVQIGVIDLLKELEVIPDFFHGHSVGEIASAYLDGCLTMQQAIQIALIIESHKPKVNAQALQINLEKIITHPKRRSDIWISSFEDSIASAEFFINILYLTEQPEIPGDLYKKKNVVVLEIGDSNFSPGSSESTASWSIMKFNTHDDPALSFLQTCGIIYTLGFNPQIQIIYMNIKYPVSRSTPMICGSIRWDHSKTWRGISYMQKAADDGSGVYIDRIKPSEPEWEYLKGHVVDGRNLFPATGYLCLAWKAFAKMKNLRQSDTNIVIENCRFDRITTIGEKIIEFSTQIQANSGSFEITEGEDIISNGSIRVMTNEEKETANVSNYSGFSILEKETMNNKDIYKELSLRGYTYTEDFAKIQKCDVRATKAVIEWQGNWVTFLDNMLQTVILQYDMRTHFYVPISLGRITIQAEKHLQYIDSLGQNPLVPVHVYPTSGKIECGGIHITGMVMKSIARQIPNQSPLLEKYIFVPNESDQTLNESLRIISQILIENTSSLKLNIIEVIDQDQRDKFVPLGPILYDVLSDIPPIQADIYLYGDVEGKFRNVKRLQTKEQAYKSYYDLLIVSGILQNVYTRRKVLQTPRLNGFILSRELLNANNSALPGLNTIAMHNTTEEKLVLLKTVSEKNFENAIVIEVSQQDSEFTWLSSLKSIKNNQSKIILYCQNEPQHGLLGFYRSYKKEETGMKLICFVIDGKQTPPFDIYHPFYQKQLEKNLDVNIFKDGKWGTYRYLLMNENIAVDTNFCTIDQTIRGNVSSIQWSESNANLFMESANDKEIVEIFYASLNFRDVMTAYGLISYKDLKKGHTEQGCDLGLEFSGLDSGGRRVMGLASSGALSTIIDADKSFLYEIPDEWTLEQAATVPVAYTTVLLALLERGRLRKGETILIHSGTGAVGQAAIHVALKHECTVFTTVGTPAKRELIKELFPSMKDEHIGSSRDTSFEKLIYRNTKGRGVDVVLNSLVKDKLQASIRCLVRGGRFIEIGKVDLLENKSLPLLLLKKECSFHGVMVDHIFDSPLFRKKGLRTLLNNGMKNGYVKPLKTSLFEMQEVEKAIRFMATGQHTEKVVVRIRKPEHRHTTCAPQPLLSRANARYFCHPEKTYIIIGGLGGFGMEFASWLILRGARRLLLSSRAGIKNGHQSYRIRLWRSYGTIIRISTSDITTRAGCETLISEAESLGPIEGIFNLALILKDALLENQTKETFEAVLKPKATCTKFLDELTRKRCPELRDFVVFSSMVSGRGNSGQTNYGMANSIMENVCEKRLKDGYPALGIQWGAIGDVGVLADDESNGIMFDGIGYQRISSCLKMMDKLLRQKQAAIVSSIVLSTRDDKHNKVSKNIVAVFEKALGINRKNVSLTASFGQLGMDSITLVEIQQVLQRDYHITLSAREIRTMTFTGLQILQDSTSVNQSGSYLSNVINSSPLHSIISTTTTDTDQPYLKLPSLLSDDDNGPFLFCFPGIEGHANNFKYCASQLEAKVVGLQFPYSTYPMSLTQMSEQALKIIQEIVKPTENVFIVSHCWGTSVALKTVSLLEKLGFSIYVIIVDGSPFLLQEILKVKLSMKNLSMKESLEENSRFGELLRRFIRSADRNRLMDSSVPELSVQNLYDRLVAIDNPNMNFDDVYSPTWLIKPSTALIETDLSEDYNLPQICKNFQGFSVVEGDHLSILSSEKLIMMMTSLIRKLSNKM